LTKSTRKKPANRPAGRPRKDGRAPITREQILNAAQQLFATQGFVGTGMRDICRKLDITPSSIFYQFPTKLSILEEIFTNIIGPELEFYQRLEQSGASAAVQLFVIISTDPNYLAGAQGELLSVIGLPEARNKELTKVFEGRKKSIEHFRKLVKTGIKDGDFRAVDPKVMGEVLTLLSETPVYTTTAIGSPGHQAKQIVEFVFHALLKDPSTLPKIAKAAKRVKVQPPTFL
jgi:AcrR family transcriptional regulator